MSCQARAGLLVLRACGDMEVGYCANCGKPLCAMHIGNGTCPDCLVLGGGWDSNDASREEAMRRQYYGNYELQPGGGSEFGAANFFGAGDHESMRRQGLAPGLTGSVPGTAGRDDYDALDT